MLVPMYNAELAPPGIRGSLVALQQLAITLGILVSYWIGYGTNCKSAIYYHNEQALTISHRRNYLQREHTHWSKRHRLAIALRYPTHSRCCTLLGYLVPSLLT